MEQEGINNAIRWDGSYCSAISTSRLITLQAPTVKAKREKWREALEIHGEEARAVAIRALADELAAAECSLTVKLMLNL